MTDTAHKRPLSDVENLLDNVKAVLVTVEGTTTPATFVKDTLITYVKDNVKTYVEQNFGNEELQAIVEEFRKQAVTDAAVEGVVSIPGKDAAQGEVVDAVASSALWMLSSGHKTQALKQIETAVWGAAFKNATLKGEVYEDVAPALHELIDKNIKVYVYASLGIETQRQLFAFSNHGDLSDLFAGYFDAVTTGSKVEKESYSKIATEVQLAAENILYLTGLPTEATAANAAGFKTCLMARNENDVNEDDAINFPSIASFDELFIDDDDIPTKKLRDGEPGYPDDSSDGSEGKGADGEDADGADD